MSRYKPYPEYKDSGVDWIGEVPVHWGADKVGALFAELNDRGGSKDQLLAVSQEHGVLPQAEYAAAVDRRLSQSQSGDYSNYKSVEPNSFVYNKMRMWQGAIGLSRYAGCVSPAYVTFRALHPVDESFYFGVFRTRGFVSEVNRLSQGICDDQNSCSFGDFRTIFVPSPPHHEQSQIATFLDRETTRIDTLVEKKQRFIELLEEKRQAVITQAVTKGLDPNVPMKDSGVEWIGEVPAHWEVKRLKNSVSSCRNGIWGSDPLGDENDIPCVRVADFCRDSLTIDLASPTLRNVTPPERIDRVLRRGDLVLEKSGGGEKQPVGAVMLYDHDTEAVCSNFTARMALKDGMAPSFWRYVHAAGYANQLNVPSIKQTSGIQNLDQRTYLNELFAFPGSEEQSQIATFLDGETTRIDTLIEKTRQSIELLKERRSALITAAVTGKIDVREEVA